MTQVIIFEKDSHLNAIELKNLFLPEPILVSSPG